MDPEQTAPICSYRSSLVCVHTVCSIGFLNISAEEKSRRLFFAIGALRVKTLCILQELDEAEKSFKAGDMSTSGDSETSIPDVQEQDDDGKTETRTCSGWGAIENPHAKVLKLTHPAPPSSTPGS